MMMFLVQKQDGPVRAGKQNQWLPESPGVRKQSLQAAEVFGALPQTPLGGMIPPRPPHLVSENKP